MMSSELYWAALRGDVTVVRTLISQGVDVNEQDTYGYTALMAAASEGYAEIVELLINEGADVNQPDSSGGTALMNPSLRGHVEVVRLLLNAGADAKSESGVRAFMYAAAGGHTRIVELFLKKGVGINSRDRSGMTALISACTSEGNIETVKFLLANGADYNAKTNGDEDTALHIAAANDKHELISFLRNAGADINARNASGATPLLYAALRGYRETIGWLLSFGADVNSPSNDGTTPMMAAASNFHFDAVERLVAGGADVNAVAVDGYSAIGALQQAYERMMELLKPTNQIQTLYRFIAFNRLEDLIIRKSTCLTQVKSWEDTYEGFHVRDIIRNTLKANYPQIADRMLDALIDHIHQCMYAQCWATIEESDALWRIYSPDKKGVRISVNREKLIGFLKTQIPPLTHGRVSYCSHKEVVGRINHELREQLQQGVALGVLLDKAFFYKRLAFSHEYEFRVGALIYPSRLIIDVPPDDSNPSDVDNAIATIRACTYQPRYCFSFDPSLIEEIILDPRASDAFLAQVQNLCASTPKTRHIVVRKSDLYGQPI